mmetsp:Transcript_13199/g.39427  ORF Transcript_13199/g.39427 Transcript_13199/m.39427 type:complete len:205 (+) Transcript_13199:112-726(+)
MLGPPPRGGKKKSPKGAARGKEHPRGSAQVLEEERRVLEEVFDGVGEAGDRRTVDDAVVRGPRDGRDNRGLDGVRVADEARNPLRAADRADGDLRRHDDGRRVRAAERADVGHGERRVRDVRGRERVGERSDAEALELRRDLEHGPRADVADDGHDEAVRRRDGHAEVVGLMLDDRRRAVDVDDRRVDAGVRARGHGAGLEPER